MASSQWSPWRTEVLWTLLPVLIMGTLAAWSFWLVRTSGSSQPSMIALPVSTEPDMVIERFTARTYDRHGDLSAWVKGKQAWHHPADDSLRIAQADMLSFGGDAARPVTVTAQSQEMWVNGPQTIFKLVGNARVQRVVTPKGTAPATMTFLGQELLIDSDRSVVISEQPVTLLHGTQRLIGERMHYDEANGILNLKGRVRWQQNGAAAKAS
jgi:lipopolysaccharide export system protein LptC